MNCTAGCATRNHASYGECLRSKGVKTVYAASAAGRDFTKEKRWNSELDAYEAARRQGIQPASTARSAVDAAVEFSNETGAAFQA